MKKIGREWKRREKKNEDEEADDENWMKEGKNDVIFNGNILRCWEGLLYQARKQLLTNFSFEFCRLFSQTMPLYL